jgi:poly-gamma-glutamate synthesis protein (capsule biosynthesis protein)
MPWTPKVFNFRASPKAIETLKIANIDYVSLANNHSLDYHEEAMFDMLERLDKAGIKHAGAGRNIKEATEPAIIEVKGVKIAIISITDNEPKWAATEDKPGVNFLKLWIWPNMLKKAKSVLLWPDLLKKAKKQIEYAKKKADLVVLSSHWGPNMRQRPESFFIKFAHKTVELGVDIFHGHSAHIFQGIEIWKGKPIMYDTGDFVDDYAVDPDLRNDLSFIFMVDIEEKQIKKLTLIPVYISMFQVNLAPEFLADVICKKMATLCFEMETETKIEDGKLIIEF